MIRLIVFDLDGTLVDSRRDLAASANELLASFGADALETPAVLAMVGEGARTLVSRVLAAGGVDADLDDALNRFLGIYDRRLLDHTRPYPGVVATLDRLAREAALAVLTNKPQAPTGRLLAELGLARYFAAAIGGDTALGRKPSPAGLQAIAARAGVAPPETLMVGDSWVDIETARRAAVRACFADYGFGEPPADGLRDGEIRIGSFEMLPALVETGR